MNIAESKLEDHIRSRDTGATVRLPAWAMFALYASSLIVAPIFVVPLLFLSVMAIVAIRPPVLMAPLMVAGVGVIILPLVTLLASSNMRRAAVLDHYLALLAADTRFGRYLTRRFGQPGAQVELEHK